MAGANIRIEVDTNKALQGVGKLIGALDNPAPLLRNIREFLTRVHRERFSSQTAPDGTPWAPLSPRYQKRKRRNKGRILTLRGYLQGSFRGIVDAEGLLFGTNLIYAAIHNFGGEIQRKAAKRSVYFKRRSDGSVGNRFVKKSKSDFAQDVSVGEHTIKMPKREFLGTSTQDDAHILRMTLRYLQNATS